MNVDLNWCPCGKQCREDSMYCSDACYLKDLSSNGKINGFARGGNYYDNEDIYSFNTSSCCHNAPHEKKSNLKVVDFRNPNDKLVLSASANLAFKNRQKNYGNSYYTRNTFAFSSSSNIYKSSSDLASSYSSSSSTIDDYFKKPSTHIKVENSPKQQPILTIDTTQKENENAKEKSYSSRSSYVIEAVYPVQNFNKNTIAVY